MPKTKQDWFTTGLETLVRQGLSGLTIDNLCQSLGVTKGSFYHHFKNHQDYQAQLLAFWQEKDTGQVVEAASQVEGLPRKIDGLIQVLGSRSVETASPELAIRAWALQDENVSGYIAQIDGQRVHLIVKMLEEVVDDGQRAYLLARMLYAMLVGSYSIIPPIERDAVIDLYQEFTRLYDR